MKVIKVGGGCLKGKQNIAQILELLGERGLGHVVVVSALSGVTDQLYGGIRLALDHDANIPPLMSSLRSKHQLVARHLIACANSMKSFNRDLNKTLMELERLYYGLNFTREITPRMQDTIVSYGERFSAYLLTFALRCRGKAATCCMPHQIGIITDGKFSDATVQTRPTRHNLKRNLAPLIRKDKIIFIPGFFGASKTGDITTFGRGGTDYSAAVVAAAMEAEILEVWKDVDGYLSADPQMVPEATLIDRLSYEEAAELSYFGAKILHPRTVEPIRRSKIHIAIKNTLNPDGEGSVITPKGNRSTSIIKSVTYNKDIGVLKVYASGVGARPGFLALVAGQLTQNGINIKSVVTSQTCISLLLARKDIEPGRTALAAIKPRPYRRLEKVVDAALISIVGEGLNKRQGIAAKCFSAVAGCSVNVEMISFGPSPVALYFLVHYRDLHKAVGAIHSTFFSAPQCRL
jgi:aspartate kinase